jgi:hypothetical protein
VLFLCFILYMIHVVYYNGLESVTGTNVFIYCSLDVEYSVVLHHKDMAAIFIATKLEMDCVTFHRWKV